MFFSSGDTGSQCPAVVGVNGVPAGLPGVNYPASSPYGIGVGGTSILSPTGPTEIAWYAGGVARACSSRHRPSSRATKVGGVAPLVRPRRPDVSPRADPEAATRSSSRERLRRSAEQVPARRPGRASGLAPRALTGAARASPALSSTTRNRPRRSTTSRSAATALRRCRAGTTRPGGTPDITSVRERLVEKARGRH